MKTPSKAQDILNKVRTEAQHAWHSLADQLHHLEQRSNHALTPFTPATKEHDEDATQAQSQTHPQWGLIPADVIEVEDMLMVTLEIPGLEANAISIEVEGNELIIGGEKSPPNSILQGGKLVNQEIAYGRFERRITLTGNRLKKTNNDASYANGVLTVCLPYDGITEETPRRSIPIQ